MLPAANYYYGLVLCLLCIVSMFIGAYGSIHGKNSKVRMFYSLLIVSAFIVLVYVSNNM